MHRFKITAATNPTREYGLDTPKEVIEFINTHGACKLYYSVTNITSYYKPRNSKESAFCDSIPLKEYQNAINEAYLLKELNNV